MENQLETIKANLPYGYEKQIAKEVGCSQGTVHNILNNKPASARSTYKAKVLNVLFGGRLGMYRYMDMDKVIEEALNMAETELTYEEA